MVYQQRHAIFNLTIAAAAVAAFAALMPVIGTGRAQGAFGLLGLLALGPFLYRGRGGQIAGDERDRVIHLRATQITFAIFWVLFVSGMMALHYLGNGQVREMLILVVWLGTAAMLICHASVLLILYRRS